MKKFYLPLIAGAMALSFAACGGQKSANGRESVELTGAGATFPLPFYNMYLQTVVTQCFVNNKSEIWS